MSKTFNKSTGNKGETVAAEYLRQKGYKILERNYRNKWGEIDVVCRAGDVVVFVEVKTKSGTQFGEPWEMITTWKVEQIERIGRMWALEHAWEGLCRVDAVSVLTTSADGIPSVTHWENVSLK